MKKGFNRKKKSSVEYPNIPSAIRPVPHRQKQTVLQSGVNVCSFRSHQQSLAQFFSMERGLVYCADVGGIMQKFGYSHRPEE